ncbi:MAG: GNAT family N-acetyltransferase [Treponema sp.]|nr:GNAT family N-acetyltransferase [Treponema sp.]
MEIKEISELENKSCWISKIKDADWRGAKYLVQLLESGNFYAHCGNTSKLFLLIDNLDLISFCTYAEKDEIPDTNLPPWIGFVYTFPQFRGKRKIGILMEHIYLLAKNEGFKNLYISTDQPGLYEKFGFTFKEKLKNRWGGDTLAYNLPIYQGIKNENN